MEWSKFYDHDHGETAREYPSFMDKEIALTSSLSFGGSPKLNVLIPERTYGKRKRSVTECVELSQENFIHNSTRREEQPFGHKKRVSFSVNGTRAKEYGSLISRMKAKSLYQRVRYLNHQGERNLNVEGLNDVTKKFIESQIKNQVLSTKGHRFSNDDKVFALSMLKHCTKGYKFLSKVFSLPSRRTLIRFLEKLNFQCGINENIFQNLNSAVQKLKPFDRYCVLMFDEISLSPGLTFNKRRDCIEGVVDYGNGDRKVAFADHALVFMIKGIHKKWKQPLSYYFCEHTTAATNLKRLIKEIIVHVHQCGLEIIATISDQGASNRGAINGLLRETKEFCIRNNVDNVYQGYLINGKEIIHLYDCPHLIKGIRNSLLKNDLVFYQDGKEKVASWTHIVNIYEKDKEWGCFSQFPKLTDEHVLPNKIRKMKVKHCTQVFSRTVAVAIKTRAGISQDLSPDSRHFFNPAAGDTADLLLFLDNLFDSVNGSFFIPPAGKPLRGVVTTNSPHVETWISSIIVLSSMGFKNPLSSRLKKIPSINNFIFTLHGFVYLWDKLSTQGFKYIVPRSFNQDPLENFYSLIRSHGVRNINPDCFTFTSSFKSLILNNFLSTHSPNANCEEDVSSGALDTLKCFAMSGSRVNLSFETPTPIYSAQHHIKFEKKLDFATAYVAGYIGRQILSKLNCKNCSYIMRTSLYIEQNRLISKKTYSGKTMFNPSKFYFDVFYELISQIFSLIPKNINSFKISGRIQSEINIPKINDLFCEKHQSYSKSFVEKSINFCLYFYVKKINKILKGTDLRHKHFDVFCNLAYQKFLSRRKQSRNNLN